MYPKRVIDGAATGSPVVKRNVDGNRHYETIPLTVIQSAKAIDKQEFAGLIYSIRQHLGQALFRTPMQGIDRETATSIHVRAI